MTMRRWLGAGAAAVVLACPAAAQQQSPEEVAQAYFAHFRAGEADRVAALTHPRALESIRTFLLQMIDGEDISDSPLAEVGDIETMSSQELFVALMEGAGEEEQFGEMFSTLEVQPLGHVVQGDSLAHVVYAARLAFMNQPSQQTMVLTLRRHSSGWLVDPGDGLMNMIGGGLMPLLVSAGMQAGMMEAMNEGNDVDVVMDADFETYFEEDEDEGDDDEDDDDEDEDDDGDDDDNDEDEDDDPPAS